MSESLEIEGVDVVAFDHRTIITIFGSIYDLLGKNGAHSLLYNVGSRTGRLFGRKEKKLTKSEGVTLLKKTQETDLKGGWGEFEYNIDFDTFEGEVRLYDSFIGKKWNDVVKKDQKFPVCVFIAGYISGLIESIFGEKIVVEEKECIATGNDHCVFKVRKGVLGD